MFLRFTTWLYRKEFQQKELIILVSNTVRELHKKALEKGGLHGEAKDSSLESAVARVFQKSVYENEEIKSELSKICFLCESLVKAHAFNDGNKRTAFLVLQYFCNMDFSSLLKIKPNQEIEKMLIEIAVNNKNYKDLEFLIRKSDPLPLS